MQHTPSITPPIKTRTVCGLNFGLQTHVLNIEGIPLTSHLTLEAVWGQKKDFHLHVFQDM